MRGRERRRLERKLIRYELQRRWLADPKNSLQLLRELYGDQSFDLHQADPFAMLRHGENYEGGYLRIPTLDAWKK